MQVDFRKGLRHVAPLSSVTVRSNGPFRADVCWCTYAPGLWPGLAETAFQAENLVEILLVRSSKKWRCPTTYEKPLHGSIAASRIGIDTMLPECPHFQEWL